MSKFYITTETRQQVRRILAMKGDDQTITVDFTPWAEDNSDVSTATWSVESGSASIDGEDLTTNVATARITTSKAGKSLIKLSATDGTRTKVVYFRVFAREPNNIYPASDYGMVVG